MDTSTINPVETWRGVVGWSGAYEVSDQGHVRSLPGSGRRGVILQAGTNRKGYKYVRLCRSDLKRTPVVHALVAEAFIGPRPDGYQIRHLNGDPSDNRSGNLAYGTASENALDQVQHGRHPHARETHCIHGHEFNGANTYWYQEPTGRHRPRRICLACKKERKRAA